MASLNTNLLTEGTHTLTLKVCRSFGGHGAEGEGGILPPPVLAICRAHTVNFEVPPRDGLLASLYPDSAITVSSDMPQLDYSLDIINPTDNQIDFKYQIDYTYSDSNYIFLGPYELGLNQHSSFQRSVQLSTIFTEADSSGIYMWNLRLLDLNDELIDVDSLKVIKE